MQSARDLTPYHRLTRELPNHRWWKPLAALGLTAVSYVLIVLLVVLAVGNLVPGGQIHVNRLLVGATEFLIDPVALVLFLGVIVALLPALTIGVSIVYGRSLGLLASVRGRLRLRPLVVSLVVALAACSVEFLLVSISLDAARIPWSRAWLPLLLMVVLVPLQAGAEEFFFRGMLMQTVGAWVRPVAVAILVQTVLFAAAHGYRPSGAVVVGTIGLVAGWLTWRTGGLEAGIALHTVNNWVAFLPSVLGLGAAGESGDVPWQAVPLLVAPAVVHAVVIEVLLRRGLYLPAEEPAVEGVPAVEEPVGTAPGEAAPGGAAPGGAAVSDEAFGRLTRIAHTDDAGDRAASPV